MLALIVELRVSTPEIPEQDHPIPSTGDHPSTLFLLEFVPVLKRLVDANPPDDADVAFEDVERFPSVTRSMRRIEQVKDPHAGIDRTGDQLHDLASLCRRGRRRGRRARLSPNVEVHIPILSSPRITERELILFTHQQRLEEPPSDRRDASSVALEDVGDEPAFRIPDLDDPIRGPRGEQGVLRLVPLVVYRVRRCWEGRRDGQTDDGRLVGLVLGELAVV